MKTTITDSLGCRQVVRVPFGLTVREMIEKMGLSGEVVDVWIRQPALAANAFAVEFERLPRLMWGYVKPKLDGVVCFSVRTGSKGTLQAIIAVAAIVATIIAPWAALPGYVMGGLALAGMAVNLLYPDETASLPLSNETEAGNVLANVQSDSNPVAKGGYLPIVVGTRRINPPELSDPIFSMDDSSQVVQRIFAFDGRHELSDVYVDDAPVSDYDAITTEIVDGAEDGPTSTFIEKVAKYESVSTQLTSFSLDDAALVNQTTPSNSEPSYTRFTTIGDAYMEEIVIRLQINSMVKSDAPTTDLRMPLRIRFREKGSSGAWSYLPEIHITGRDQGSNIKEIRVRWDAVFGSENEAGDFGYEFFQRVPASDYTLSSGNTSDQWQANSHFVADTGLKDTQNITGGRQGVRVVLDEDFAKTSYEWEIKRGLSLVKSNINDSYQYSSKIISLFEGYLLDQTYSAIFDQSAFNGSVSVNHSLVIVNQQPCQKPKTALLAVQSIDESIQNVTVLASRYVLDWDGAAWATETTTANPATHARQLIYDLCVRLGVSTSLIDDDAFVSWRQSCIDNGWEVSAVFSGTTHSDALSTIFSAGFARPIFSDIISVDWFRDRSGDPPKVAFSPANSTMSIQISEPELPLAVRVKYQDEDDDYKDGETEVTNPFITTISGQSVKDYKGITKTSLARKRAYFDLLQSVFQGRKRMTISSATQASLCERGDLVLVTTDLENDRAFGGIVRTVQSSTTLVIDQAPEVEGTTTFFDAANVFVSENIFEEGMQSYAWVNHADGGQELRISSAHLAPEGLLTIRFATPLTNSDVEGAHIVIGTKDQMTNRWIVLEIDREAEERATLTLIPEAPQIYEYMEAFDA